MEKYQDIIKRIVTFEKSWVHRNIMHHVVSNYYHFFKILNDSLCKLQKDFVEEFNAKCNDELSASSKFSKDEVASFSLFMILEGLGDNFSWGHTKRAIESKVDVRYHSRLAEFKGCVIEHDIQTSLLAGGIVKPSNN